MSTESGPIAANPFKGLQPFEQADRDAIFGRDMDFTLMRERIYSATTTLLFAGSGVGKTSFLRARLIPSVADEFVVCYHRNWADEEPRTAVLNSLAAALPSPIDTCATLPEAVRRFRRQRVDPSQKLPLRPSPVKPRELLLVLDQFEEPFQYYAYRKEFKVFVEDLASVINADDLSVRVVLSMRDDFLGRLSVFDNLIPDLFNNYYRLKSPTKNQAMEIIVRTSARANREVDDRGLSLLVDDLATFRQTLPSSSAAANETVLRPWQQPIVDFFRRWVIGPLAKLIKVLRPAPVEPSAPIETVSRDFVLPPFLQIVCRDVWDRNDGAKFLAGYDHAEDENPAASILVRFCRTRLNGLRFVRQRDLAARALDYLMTRDGAKMAYQLGRLAEHMDEKQPDLEVVLKALSSEGILRRFKGSDNAWWYELYHDMYALILADWRRWYQAKRHDERRVKLGVASVAVTAAVFFGVAVVGHLNTVRRASEDYPRQAYDRLNANVTFGGIFDFMTRLTAIPWADYWDRRAARAELLQDRDQAILLRLEAWRVRPTPARAGAAALMLGQDYPSALAATWQAPNPPSGLYFSSDEQLLFAASEDGRGHIWDLVSGEVAPLSTAAPREAGTRDSIDRDLRAAFVGRRLITLSEAGLEIWSARAGRQEWSRDGCLQAVTAFVGSPDRESLVAGIDGDVRKVDLSAPPACEAARSPVRRSARRVEQLKYLSNTELFAERFAIDATEGTRESCFIGWTDLAPRCFPVPGRVAAVDERARRVAVLSGDFYASDQGHFQLFDFEGRAVGQRTQIMSGWEPAVSFTNAGASVQLVTRLPNATIVFDAGTGSETERREQPAAESQSAQGATADRGPGGDLSIKNSNRRLMFPIISGPIEEFEFSPGGNWLATAAADGSIRLWRMSAFRPSNSDLIPSDVPGSAPVLGAQGDCAAYASGDTVTVRHLDRQDTWTVRWQRDEETPAASIRLAVDARCEQVAATAPGIVRLWRKPGGNAVSLKVADFASRSTMDLVFSPDGSRLLAHTGRSPLATFHLWNTVKGETMVAQKVGSNSPALLESIRPSPTRTPLALFTPDSKFVILKLTSRPPLLLSADTGMSPSRSDAPILADFVDTSSVGTIGALQVDSASSRVAVGEQQRLKIFQAGPVANLEYSVRGEVSRVRFSPADTTLAIVASTSGAQLLRIGADRIDDVGASVAPGSTGGNRVGITSAEFARDGTTVFLSTGRWLHRLAVDGATGLRPLASRRWSGSLIGELRVTDAPTKVIAVVRVGEDTRIETIDFDALPGGAELPDLKQIENQLGRRLDQASGNVITVVSVPAPRQPEQRGRQARVPSGTPRSFPATRAAAAPSAGDRPLRTGPLPPWRTSPGRGSIR